MKRWLFFSVTKFLLVMLPAVVLAWPIPDTGQTACYDALGTEIDCAGTGQDGEYLINPPSYTKLDANGNDLPDTAEEWVMVRDNVTGLIWEVKQNRDGGQDYTNPNDADNTYSWYCPDCPDNGGVDGTPGDGTDTQDFLAALNAGNGFGGFSDWRLPTREELRSIVNYGVEYPAVDTEYFPNTFSSNYWSSATDASYATSYAWYVDFGNPSGYDHGNKSYSRYVRAVRGGQGRSLGHWAIGPDDTVTDTRTGLMWRRTTDSRRTWWDAVRHCGNMTTAGYDDWRLPTIKELASIAALDRSAPAIDASVFSDTWSAKYWSSTTNIWPTTTNANGTAWYVSFDSGNGSINEKWSSPYVRAVRGGQAQSLGNLIISTPRQASFWNIDSTVPVTWDTADIPGNVKISISSEGGRPGTFRIIAESTPNDGAYDWTIAGKPSYNCMLKIEPLSDPSKGTVQGLFTVLYYLYATPSSFGLVEPTAPDETPESKTFRVKLTRDPGGEVALDIASSNPGECTVFPRRIVMDSGNWNAGVEITVTPEYDGFADGDQVTSVLASTTDSLAAFQAVDFPLVQVIVQDSDTGAAIHSVSPAYGEAGQPLAVTMEGANFTSSTPLFILPDGGAATQISPVTFVNDTTLSFTIPAQAAGSYTLRADAFDLESAVAFTDSTAIAAQGRKKAIIAAGSGPFFDNGFWLATDKCATHAYETLVSLGYDPADIQFLSAALERTSPETAKTTWTPTPPSPPSRPPSTP